MANSNYVRGRAFEYQLKRDLEADGWLVMRASGSHGIFDLIALRETSEDRETRLIQCKVTKDKKQIDRLKKEFDSNLPFKYFTQQLAIKITGSRDYIYYTPEG